MAAENKTEQATPQRRRKAREKGQIARSRELSSALAIVAAVLVIAWQSDSAVLQWRQYLSRLLDIAASSDIKMRTPVLEWGIATAMRWASLPLIVGLMLATASSFAQGGFVFATDSVTPNMERINPATKFSQLFSISSITALLKSVVPFAFIVAISYQLIARDWTLIASSSSMTVPVIFRILAGHCYEIAWKSSLVLLVWAVCDYLLIRQKQESELRMSKQEIREEAKESEGNPQVKAQIRRMQRQSHRKQMLKDVQRATVVVTNPTHFAIALEYKPEMAAPVVVAKGQNMLAQQIKQAAIWHEIPTVENPPLAQALYRSVEIGQAIPAKLYTAVAEILAFVYRTQQQVARARGGRS
jgi:flagellar biosynthetic protein FlhB